jgi:hypothetical protein
MIENLSKQQKFLAKLQNMLTAIIVSGATFPSSICYHTSSGVGRSVTSEQVRSGERAVDFLQGKSEKLFFVAV